jgi:hypothetical protein
MVMAAVWWCGDGGDDGDGVRAMAAMMATAFGRCRQ